MPRTIASPRPAPPSGAGRARSGAPPGDVEHPRQVGLRYAAAAVGDRQQRAAFAASRPASTSHVPPRRAVCRMALVTRLVSARDSSRASARTASGPLAGRPAGRRARRASGSVLATASLTRSPSPTWSSGQPQGARTGCGTARTGPRPWRPAGPPRRGSAGDSGPGRWPGRPPVPRPSPAIPPAASAGRATPRRRAARRDCSSARSRSRDLASFAPVAASSRRQRRELRGQRQRRRSNWRRLRRRGTGRPAAAPRCPTATCRPSSQRDRGRHDAGDDAHHHDDAEVVLRDEHRVGGAERAGHDREHGPMARLARSDSAASARRSSRITP